MRRVAGSVQRLAAEELNELGLNTGSHSVLRLLADEGPRSQQRLAEALRIDRTTVVGLVDDLERTGGLERRRDPGDRRAYLVEITPAGRTVLAAADGRVADLQAAIFAPMRQEDRTEFVRLLRLLIDAGHLPGFARGGDQRGTRAAAKVSVRRSRNPSDS